MCLSCELHDKWPPFIEFLIWFTLQGINVGNHFAVYIVLQSHVIDLTHPLYRNTTHPNATINADKTTVNITSLNVSTKAPTIGGLIPLNTTPPAPVVAAVPKVLPTKWVNGKNSYFQITLLTVLSWEKGKFSGVQ